MGNDALFRAVPLEELPEGMAGEYKKRRLRRFLLLVTLPGLVLGTGTVATAYSTGLLGAEKEAPCVSVTTTAPKRGTFDISVVNSNDVAGQGADVAKQLTNRDFKVTRIGNAPDSVYIKGVATIYHGKDGLDGALLLQKQMPGAELWDDSRPGTGVEVVLGHGFKRLRKEAPKPAPAPSQIKVNVYNTTYKEGLAKQIAGQLEKRRFKIGEVSQDPQLAWYADDTAVIRFGPDGEERAKRLQEHVPGVRLMRDDRSGATLDLVLGAKFTALTPASKIPEVKPFVRKAETIERPCPTS
ncbi:LytR C-terminal domain-containing protein [Kribbia dieselivorans]|uniref:LytR C-terminal domain-containing protein n=1 Tax=Kribbia dieselivorans TaxID=331526 RepID=UPI0008382ED6|nr:LytR C-terminal domain-containing protein [Kribbia dieselivorans]